MTQFLQALAATFGFVALVGFLVSKSYGAAAPPHAADFRVRVVEAVIFAEGRTEGVEGQLAIAEVIRNRMARSGKSAYETVTQRKQFSCLNSTTPEKLVERQKVSALGLEGFVYRISRALVFDPFSFDDDTVKGATHYHEVSVHPDWARPDRRTVQIRHHIFYRL